MNEERSKKRDGVTAVGDILARLKTTGTLGKQLELAQIWEHWTELAGEQLSLHGQPYTVKDGQLRVRADSTVWMHKYSFHKWKIIRRINRMARKELIHDLFVTLKPEEEPENTEPEPIQPRKTRRRPNDTKQDRSV